MAVVGLLLLCRGGCGNLYRRRRDCDHYVHWSRLWQAADGRHDECRWCGAPCRCTQSTDAPHTWAGNTHSQTQSTLNFYSALYKTWDGGRRRITMWTRLTWPGNTLALAGQVIIHASPGQVIPERWTMQHCKMADYTAGLENTIIPVLHFQRPRNNPAQTHDGGVARS